MEKDRKELWKSLRGELFSRLVPRELPPEEFLERMHRYNRAIFETPKTFVDGVAYNDGSWMKYSYNGTMRCANKDEILKHIYGYLCFLLRAGVEDPEELLYYGVCFLIERLEYKPGLFGCSCDNKGKLNGMIYKVIAKSPDAKTAVKDEREFCLAPDLTKKMSTGEKTKMQKMVQKKLTDGKIKGLYDPELSVRKNAEMMVERGLDVSPSRVQQWINEYVRG